MVDALAGIGSGLPLGFHVFSEPPPSTLPFLLGGVWFVMIKGLSLLIP